ncbi:MAG: hypothetical protein JXB50_00465 [Spirochaetes bacterium]|nr:hypothetical protein [Spirochaetota bacterium]
MSSIIIDNGKNLKVLLDDINKGIDLLYEKADNISDQFDKNDVKDILNVLNEINKKIKKIKPIG